MKYVIGAYPTAGDVVPVSYFLQSIYLARLNKLQALDPRHPYPLLTTYDRVSHHPVASLVVTLTSYEAT